ncbi:MAG: ABC transporter substrate-binding protein [Andreesenia angusta]|nr:ABC transporter substrate-binding protein [Andreesenia angusta]
MKKSKVLFLCMFILMLALPLSACGDNDNNDNGGEQKNSKQEQTKPGERDRKGRAKDELVVSMGESVPHEFDPRKRHGMYNEAHITHSTLLRKTPNLDIVGDFAKDYEISEDGLLWTFNLHDNFKFSNGEPVTAEDVKFSYEMLIEDGQHWDLDFIDKIIIPEENKMEFHLKEPRSTFTAQLSEVPIVPKDHYDDNYSKNPIGSGPYMVSEHNPNEQAIFEVNPHWHGEEPYFKKWTWVLLEENTALAALESGDVDIIYSIPEFADKEVKGCKLFEFESNDVRGLSMPYVKKGEVDSSPDGYPVGNDVTSDPAIRKALNIGMNRQKVVDTVLNGHGKPAYSIIDNIPEFNPETAIEDNRVDEAKELLDKAGWIEGKNGVREKDGLKASFKLYYPTQDQLRTNIAIEAAEQAKPLGIDIELVGSNWDEMATKAHESALLYAGGRLNPTMFYTSHNPEAAGRGWTNVTFYDNPKVTEYMEKAITSIDPEEALKYWHLAQWDGETGASTLGDLPNVWLVRWNHTYIGDERIDVGEQGIHSHGHDWALLHNIAKWKWSEKAK